MVVYEGVPAFAFKEHFLPLKERHPLVKEMFLNALDIKTNGKAEARYVNWEKFL